MLLFSICYLSNVAAIEEGRQLLEAEPFQVYNKLLYPFIFVFSYIEFGLYICAQTYYYIC